MANKTPNRPAATRRVANSLVSLGSAAVLAIYAAGYQRTRSAAEELEAASAQRRPAIPRPAPGGNGEPAAARTPETTRVAPLGAPVAPVASPPVAAPVVETTRNASLESRANRAVDAPVPAPVAPVTAAPVVTAVTAAAAPAPEPVAPPVSAVAVATVAAPGTPAAANTVTAAPATPAAAPTPYKDGTYHAWGRSRHGDVYAFVVIENGRIVHSGYDKCQTRWSCDLIDHLGPQVVKRQSAEVDYVSGATESGNAFYWGVSEALAKAKVGAAEGGAVPVAGESGRP